MAKRAATVQLTSDNFEEENEEENVTTEGFIKASETELRRRDIKKAKRNLPEKTTGMQGNGGLFSGINLSSTSTTCPFQHLTMPKVALPMLPKLTPPSQPPSMTNGARDSKYLTKLRSLNVSVSEWITQHVQQNPCIDLTPIFKDYSKYMKEIEDSKTDEEEKKMEDTEQGVEKDDDEEEEEEEEATHSESEKSEMSSQSSQDSKVDSQAVSTDDVNSIITIRSKLYYKKGDSFVELGVGKLCVTKVEKGGVRLLLRNDTSLAQILLNVYLTGSVPLSLQKNHVLLVCHPNPPLDSKKSETSEGPVTYSLKVKDIHLAKELHSAIKNNL